ncbi:MAG: Na/Pi cotransporter family protein [Lachnospiraceae bacterium]|nr:Na/Pi cotransporter family protein [Lachnospiraceae bacterium]
MDFFGLLTMIGGLALFLYGMRTMGDALARMAGGRLEQVLERMTNNPVKAVLLGAGVTAVIQSSSATTVMVVGFVNSGIMKLSQAVGVIMGANIGTTVTSWILSLSGIESGNFFVKLLKPSSFSPVLALVGVILVMFVKNTKKNDVGTILIGFAVLMFGMETMSGAVRPLANVPEFTALFTAFENPVLGMVVGAVLTAVIQSSSASVGILQAMCATGSVTVGAALPVIMGQNIGTCVTALLSGVGANRNARRASLVHLYFNLIGTFVFMTAFYTLNHFVQFAFLSDTANGAVIAVIHSVFNIVATVVLLPASRLMEKLAYFTIPQSGDETLETPGKALDERFLEKPAFAVAQCKNAVCDMAQLILKAMNLCVFVQEKYDENAVQTIMEIEQEVDAREDALLSYLTKLSTKPLSEQDSKTINRFSRCITDFERISDYTKGIAFAQRKLHKGMEKGHSKEKFSRNATAEAKLIYAAALEIVECTVSGFIHGDKEMAFCIDPLADVICQLKKDIRKNHNKRLEKGKCSVELGMALTDMVTSLERIAKHCSNIAEEQMASETDQHALHQYARDVKERNELYKELLEGYTQKYSLEKA